MGVKAVLFDVGGVLFSPPQEAIAETEREIELPLLALAFVTGEPNNGFCRLERGEFTLSQFFPVFDQEVHNLARSKGISMPLGFSSRELFQKIGAGIRPIPAMMRTIGLLKREGFKVCVITNNWIDDTSDRNEQLDRFFGKYFDVVLQSCKLGLRKPDPRIYQLACQKLGIAPSEAVFLDDLGRNLKPARALGMATIRVRDALSALRELERIVGVQLVGEEEEEEMLAKSLTGQAEGGRGVVMKSKHSSVKGLELRYHSKL